MLAWMRLTVFDEGMSVVDHLFGLECFRCAMEEGQLPLVRDRRRVHRLGYSANSWISGRDTRRGHDIYVLIYSRISLLIIHMSDVLTPG